MPTRQSDLMTWLNYFGSIHVSAIDLGLARVRPVAEFLGVLNPDATVFTVAGTNGKGSTTATIASILQQAEYKVGLYQSPHIFKFNERIQIAGKMVDDDALIDAFVQVETARQACDLSLSFFEATTLAAFLLFQQQQCDVWVLEVGLGGRLDVVNLIDADIAVITNIGIDHVEWLGDQIEQIAYEKAGIIRDGIPVIFAGDQVLPQAILEKVQAHQATLYQYRRDYFVQQQDGRLNIATANLTLSLPQGRLASINQAAGVMAVLASGLAVEQAHLAQGVAQTRLAGRFQGVSYQGRQVILDVAHNAHGATFLKQQLQLYLQQNPQIQRVVAVFSMLGDKDIAEVTKCLATCIEKWYIAPLAVPRAADLTQLQQALTGQDYVVSASLLHSLDLAVADSTAQDLILVCGSFHSLEAVWEHLHHGNE